MDDLVTWLRAQLDNEELVARAAIAANDGEASWPIEEPDPGRMPRLLWLNVMDSCDPASIPPAMAEHISRGDPEHRLAEVDAKRQRLDWIAGELADDPTDETAQWLAKLEALPYADRAGYRDEWRP